MEPASTAAGIGEFSAYGGGYSREQQKQPGSCHSHSRGTARLAHASGCMGAGALATWLPPKHGSCKNDEFFGGICSIRIRVPPQPGSSCQ